MSLSTRTVSPLRRARWAFWLLVGVAILAAGSLNAGLDAEPSPLTGLRVAASGIAVISSVALAARVMVALERARRRARRDSDRVPAAML